MIGIEEPLVEEVTGGGGGGAAAGSTRQDRSSLWRKPCWCSSRRLWFPIASLGGKLPEGTHALHRGTVQLWVLVETITKQEYIKLIEALCNDHKIDLLKVSDAMTLSTSAGLAKSDR